MWFCQLNIPYIGNYTYTDEVKIDCKNKKGKNYGKCRKRYLRAPIRQEIGKELLTKGAELYRTGQAAKRMKPGDGEPTTLPNASVLRVMRTEEVNSRHLHDTSGPVIKEIYIYIMRATIYLVFV